MEHSTIQKPRTPLPDLFWAKVVDNGDCWLWTGGTGRAGYGVYKHDGWKQPAHRLAYEDLRAPIPAGLVLDHLCKVPACVNPWHLEPVTQRVNVQRSWPATKAHCANGHPWAADNTRITAQGHRRCRICSRDWAAAKRAERRAS